MAITTISSREFNQDAGKAKKAAQAGPVIITDRGRPAHVLLTIEDYRRLQGAPGDNIADLLAMDVETDDPAAELTGRELFRPADLS